MTEINNFFKGIYNIIKKDEDYVIYVLKKMESIK